MAYRSVYQLGSTAALKDEDFDEEDRQARRREAWFCRAQQFLLSA